TTYNDEPLVAERRVGASLAAGPGLLGLPCCGSGVGCVVPPHALKVGRTQVAKTARARTDMAPPRATFTPHRRWAIQARGERRGSADARVRGVRVIAGWHTAARGTEL